MPRIEIKTASIDDVEDLTPLFDGYRIFYRQSSDLDRARSFLLDRFRNGESVIFIALIGGEPSGFIQMYPSFSSVSTARVWILNDLFVSPNKRRQGVALALMRHAAEWAKGQNSVRLLLETARDNGQAKALYERMGWRVDTEFDRYSLELGSD